MLTRLSLSTLLAALLLSLLAVATGAGAEPLLSDSEGDAVLEVSTQGQAHGAVLPPVEETAYVDLLALDVEETDQAFAFTIHTRGFDTDGAVRHDITFEWNGVRYLVASFWGRFNGNEGFAAFLGVDKGEDFTEVAELEMSMDPAAGTMTVGVPKVYILDADNRVPLKGDELKAIVAEANGFQFRIGGLFDTTHRWYDRMPDDGDASLTVSVGGDATGHLVLGSADPVRLSNGGATTFVFETILRNTASSEDTVELSIADVPEDWTIRVPSPVRVAAGEDKRVTVLASLPFKHIHGGFDAFTLKAASTTDRSATSSLRLGVLHTPIPFPAGHHSEVYLHARNFNIAPFDQIFPWSPPYMNTVDDHAGDVPWATSNHFEDRIGWKIVLNPQLGIGLDFRPQETGVVDAVVLGNYVGDAVATAGFWLEVNGELKELLGSTPQQKVAMDPTKPTPVHIEFDIQNTADLIPHAPRQNLVLLMTLEPEAPYICCIGLKFAPQISTADFRMSLPLNEYHDPLPPEADIFGAVDLKPVGAVELLAPPGSSVEYGFTLVNKRSKAETFDLAVQGGGAAHATILPGNAIRLDGGKSQLVGIVLHVPPDAPTGQRFEAVLVATAKGDSTETALVRTVTTVDAQSAAPRAGDLKLQGLDETNDAPGFGFVVVAVAVAVGARRRR